MARLYVFANSYLSGLQKGLQTAHLVNEFSRQEFWKDNEVYRHWKWNDNTIIILEGGSHKSILETYFKLQEYGGVLNYPTAIFYEDEDSLSGAATVCGIIVDNEYYYYDDNENVIQNLHKLLSEGKLAT